jgi:hypothetical protein
MQKYRTKNKMEIAEERKKDSDIAKQDPVKSMNSFCRK